MRSALKVTLVFVNNSLVTAKTFKMLTVMTKISTARLFKNHFQRPDHQMAEKWRTLPSHTLQTFEPSLP